MGGGVVIIFSSAHLVCRGWFGILWMGWPKEKAPEHTHTPLRLMDEHIIRFSLCGHLCCCCCCCVLLAVSLSWDGWRWRIYHSADGWMDGWMLCWERYNKYTKQLID
ncbi:uncharacterized protein LY89DRAFT_268542 [Mollisia scopiformis]|uniref:Uncharacterized protein n=1 Tax=Mollisia scopiformis TaxID=149040 RepID=A0A132BCC6_MOLSC|nr:uncharacterized protein LY89DRAFT_268542 [Mollisia scopiformis]KUJ10046.1 hypothetical protein LY89DRAFT_268542 [Mollisia scopiformis]